MAEESDTSNAELELGARRRRERRAVEEAGGGESEGFELAEEQLVERASHGDEHTPSRILRDAGVVDEDGQAIDPDGYSEAAGETKPD